MSIIDETKFVERFQFFDGQRLFASDLQGLETFNREMRWLHNRSLHQPGVGSGFAVGGKKGDREVTVGPGYASDVDGREIFLTNTQTLPIPPVAGDKGSPNFFDLAIAYPDDAALEEVETREGICSDRGVTRLSEAPVFCWVELAGDPLTPRKTKLGRDLQMGLMIRLARIAVLNCELYSDVSIAQRQNARVAVTPYIASGTEELGSVMVLNTKTPTSARNPQIITGTVDTRSAEFLTIPEYRAHVAGPRDITLTTQTGSSTQNVDFVIFDQFQITAQNRGNFEFVSLILVLGADLDLSQNDVPGLDEAGNPVTRTRFEEIQRRMLTQWHVIWMGTEG
ncbi:MAG TPA: hypothetical protein VMZ30_02435 [Pyrinomonadaceae bacterium]|nr:hypothetical protein [Pyrinomonadaceae bacterium]